MRSSHLWWESFHPSFELCTKVQINHATSYLISPKISISKINCPVSILSNASMCVLKVAFIQKMRYFSQISKQNIPNHYPENEIWRSCLLGRKFKFQGQDSDLKYFFRKFGYLTNPLSEKKTFSSKYLTKNTVIKST